MTPNIDIATGWMPHIVHMCIFATVAMSFGKQMFRINNTLIENKFAALHNMNSITFCAPSL
jgi:hypothetical protein